MAMMEILGTIWDAFMKGLKYTFVAIAFVFGAYVATQLVSTMLQILEQIMER